MVQRAPFNDNEWRSKEPISRALTRRHTPQRPSVSVCTRAKAALLVNTPRWMKPGCLHSPSLRGAGAIEPAHWLQPTSAAAANGSTVFLPAQPMRGWFCRLGANGVPGLPVTMQRWGAWSFIATQLPLSCQDAEENRAWEARGEKVGAAALSGPRPARQLLHGGGSGAFLQTLTDRAEKV